MQLWKPEAEVPRIIALPPHHHAAWKTPPYQWEEPHSEGQGQHPMEESEGNTQHYIWGILYFFWEHVLGSRKKSDQEE